jgi:hypothetical protein
MVRALTYTIAAAAAALSASGGAAQCQLCAQPAAAAALPAASTLSIQIDTAIDFSRVALITVGQGGTVTIDPKTGARTVAGALQDLQGIPVQGTVTVRGTPNQSLQVVLPASATLSTTGGGTVQLTALTTDLKNNPRTDHTGVLRFSFGGRLLVNGSSYGDFRGNIPITVDYK